jgi:hypothetical protein
MIGDFQAPVIFSALWSFHFVVQTGSTPGVATEVWFILFISHPFFYFFFSLLDRVDSSGVHNGIFMFANHGKSFSRIVKLSKLKSVNYI